MIDRREFIKRALMTALAAAAGAAIGSCRAEDDDGPMGPVELDRAHVGVDPASGPDRTCAQVWSMDGLVAELVGEVTIGIDPDWTRAMHVEGVRIQAGRAIANVTLAMDRLWQSVYIQNGDGREFRTDDQGVTWRVL